MVSSKVQPVDTLKAWSSIPRLLRNSVAGLSARQLDGRHGSENWSIREYVHHLIEANIIASTIVIAALGKPGSVYDWSWVQPEGEWVTRLGYNRVALEPGLALLELLCRYITLVVRTSPRGLAGHVQLKDTGAGALDKRTVEQVLRDEWEHAQHHLHDIAEARSVRAVQNRSKRRTGA